MNPINVGIVGVHPEKGWATTAHVPALKLLPGYRITTISHHQDDVSKAAAAKFDIPNAVATTEDLVQHPDVELVVITVKVPRHLELVTAAINAGKSVFCEWPLGVNLEQAIEMHALAKARGVRAFVGLQTRAVPAVNFVRDQIDAGYVGQVRSSTVIGSGILWGEEMSEGFRYTLDRQNGAHMLPVPFGHTIDGVLFALRSRLSDVRAALTTVRKTTRITETGEDVAMGVPDQIGVAGRLENGGFLGVHFRGGLSRATNFLWEINGSEGDLVVTSPVGYVGVGGFQVRGARGTETLHELEVPGAGRLAPGIWQSVAMAYERLESDLRSGTHLTPTFEDAVQLHRLLRTIEESGKRHE